MLFITAEEYYTPIGQLTDNSIVHRIERCAAKQFGWEMVDGIMKVISTKSIREACAAFDCMSCFRVLL